MGVCGGKEAPPPSKAPRVRRKSGQNEGGPTSPRSSARGNAAKAGVGTKKTFARRPSALERAEQRAREKAELEARPEVGLPAVAQDKPCVAARDLTGSAATHATNLLHAVGEAQSLNQAVLALREGACPNILDENGDTPLCHAIVAPTFHTVRGLSVLNHLATRAVVQASPHALTLAASAGRVRACALLLDLEAEVDGAELGAALSTVAEDDDAEQFDSDAGLAVLQRLLKARPEAIGHVDECGDTPLHNAVKYGHPRAAQLLITHGADVTERDAADRLPVHNAVDMPEKPEAVTVLEELLKRAPELKDARDAEGDTPLHFAALLQKVEFAKVLLAHNCDKTAKNNAGETPAAVAQGKGHLQLAELLAV